MFASPRKRHNKKESLQNRKYKHETEKEECQRIPLNNLYFSAFQFADLFDILAQHCLGQVWADFVGRFR